jgi:hypothetical protein
MDPYWLGANILASPARSVKWPAPILWHHFATGTSGARPEGDRACDLPPLGALTIARFHLTY